MTNPKRLKLQQNQSRLDTLEPWAQHVAVPPAADPELEMRKLELLKEGMRELKDLVYPFVETYQNIHAHRASLSTQSLWALVLMVFGVLAAVVFLAVRETLSGDTVAVIITGTVGYVLINMRKLLGTRPSEERPPTEANQ